MEKLSEALADALKKFQPQTVVMLCVMGWLVYTCTVSTKEVLTANTNSIAGLNVAITRLTDKIER